MNKNRRRSTTKVVFGVFTLSCCVVNIGFSSCIFIGLALGQNLYMQFWILLGCYSLIDGCISFYWLRSIVNQLSDMDKSIAQSKSKSKQREFAIKVFKICFFYSSHCSTWYRRTFFLDINRYTKIMDVAFSILFWKTYHFLVDFIAHNPNLFRNNKKNEKSTNQSSAKST